MSGDHNMYCSANNPIAWMSPDGKVSQTEGKLFHIPLYAAQKPLSVEDIGLLSTDKRFDYIHPQTLLMIVRLIEERHGIK